ncbi:sugar transferase [Fictibacillus sp. b24]|uniref:sugar transferase n=1 Tax=Fictibacillus sp. b24 TaxID=3055863 RepID=UPI0025A23F1E|nr:sugar transferase [Fictibacillus sp. b24]MDM5314857.1 sugar transferase [Fictibacillus sp. b24]
MLEGYKDRFYVLIMAMGDSILVFTSFLLANLLYGFLDYGILLPSNTFVLSISFASIGLFFFFDCYSFVKRKRIKSILINSVLALSLLNVSQLFVNSLGFILFTFMIQVVLISLFRFGLWYRSQWNMGQKKVWVISDDPDETNTIIDKVLNHTNGWFELSGFVLSKDFKKLYAYKSDLDVILICASVKDHHKKEIIDYFSSAKKEILFIPDLTDLLVATSEPQQVHDMMVYSIQPSTLSRGDHTLKRLFDIVISSCLLVVSSPIMLLLYVIIPLTSKGPALFLQERIGLNGKSYFVYKFRSMEENAEEETGPILARDNDPRVTTLGKWIRATRLDELPQLFNVLQGEMSIVGPRPERDYFIQQFKDKIPQYKQRFSVKPGITGLAQVLGNYTTSVEDKLRYDLMYIRQYSLVLDVKILLQTLRVILQRDQAKGVRISSFAPPKELTVPSLKINKQRKV